MPNENTFKVGDVVLLKSGSPKMTVYVIDKNADFIFCTWHSSNEDIFKERKFHSECLKAI